MELVDKKNGEWLNSHSPLINRAATANHGTPREVSVRNYVIRSLLSGIILLFFMSVVIFVLVRIVPGDPALGILAAKASAERGIDPVRHAELREKMGLNEPMVKQYGLLDSRYGHGGFGQLDRLPQQACPRGGQEQVRRHATDNCHGTGTDPSDRSDLWNGGRH